MPARSRGNWGRHPEQVDRWTWLVALAYTQLCLACPLIADYRLPWEKPLAEGKLTPHTRKPTETLRTLALTAQRSPLEACSTLSCRQKGT